MHKVKIETFEGPLDLLLQLIEKQKLEITSVALSDVTEQYIKTLNESSTGTVRAEELADFLVIAARLLQIKSRALLPFLQWGDDEETGEELARQLKIYKEFQDASKIIQKILGKKKYAFSRQKMIVTKEFVFTPPDSITCLVLAETFAEIIKSLSPFVNLPEQTLKKSINIQEKIEHIRKHIFSQATSRFSEILKTAKDRSEVIVSFLALLELVKQKVVVVRQLDVFDDIEIEKLT